MPVLLVDDDFTIVSGLNQLLALENIASSIATDPDEAESMARSLFFPVVLADIRLRTEDDGLRLIEQIRTISPGSKIAAMTGYATPSMEERLNEIGIVELLRKPFDNDVFLSMVRRLRGADDDTIYRRTAPRLRAMMFRRYGLPRQDCEDIVQQAWCVALEHRSEIRDLGSFLAGTAINLSRQTIHRTVREMSLESVPAADCGYVHDETNTILLRSAMARLDERSRALCVLIGLEQLSYGEVAALLKMPIGSVGPLWMRAKDRLRRELTN